MKCEDTLNCWNKCLCLGGERQWLEKRMREVFGLLVTSIGEGNGTPLQYSCLENPMDGGAWEVAVHGVVKSWTGLSDFTFTFHFYVLEKEMATHSSVLAWRIPGMGSHRVGHAWSDLAVAVVITSISCAWGLKELDTTEWLNWTELKATNKHSYLFLFLLFEKLELLQFIIYFYWKRI